MLDLLQIGTSFWIILAIFFGAVELFTMGLVTLWFCGGALVATLTAFLGLPEALQVVVFFVVSGVLLWFTRPIAQNMLNAKTEKTNYEAVIGCMAIVEKDIEPFNPGQVRIQGKEWTAICVDEGLTIERNRKVLVKEVQGVKLIVAPVDENTDELEAV